MTQLEARLRLAVMRCGIKQADLAEIAGVPQPSISNFVNGKRGLTLDSAGKLCMALGLVLESINRGVT